MTTTKLLTAEDLYQFEGDSNRYDLIRGELIQMSPAGGEHGELASTINGFLWVHVRERRLGKTYGAETGFILARDPDVVLAPDAAFIHAGRISTEMDQTRFLEIAPDLVVEIISPSDLARDVQTKVRTYLAHGVRLVWVVEPRQQYVTVYTADGSARFITYEEDLDGGDVLPDFLVPLSEIFP